MSDHREEKLTSAAEECLTSLLRLSKESGGARVTDLAACLHIQKPSVVSQIKSLAKKGLVEQQPYGRVTLTEAGKVIAGELVRKESTIVTFLRDYLGINEAIAMEDACSFEHTIHPSTLKKMVVFMKAIERTIPDKQAFLDMLEAEMPSKTGEEE
jgi:DtxR family transcriptional regulator, Mn-dependent transcriptional regulator